MAIIANSDGVATGQFTVPSNIPAGTVPVSIDGDMGSKGSTTYTGSTTITKEQRRVVTSKYNTDPLAQTFTLTEGRHICGVDLWFKKRGTSRILVQIRETTVGFPNKNVLAQASVKQSQISLSSYTRIQFRPVWLEANTEYAVVILSDDSTTAVAISELGGYDSSKRKTITSQPYQTGVLLSSSNASTWTSHQNADLTFRLLACRFSETTYEYNLGKITSPKSTDLLVKATIERVSSATDVEFSLTDAAGNVNTLAEDMPVSLREALSGDVNLKVKLKGNRKDSPVLYQGVQLFSGTQSLTGDYVTRAIPAGLNSKVRVIYDCYTPGSSTVKIYYQQADMTWTMIPLDSGSPLGDGVEERTHILESYNQTTVKIKIVLEGTVLYRPYVKNLRVTTV